MNKAQSAVSLVIYYAYLSGAGTLRQPMLDFYFTAGCIGVASYGALRHVPARLPFNFLGHFRAAQTLSLFHCTLYAVA